MLELVAPYQPTADQPQAIAKLTEGILSGAPHQTLLGVTGSGKTFAIANVVKKVSKPTLVISHNKTLAAQDRKSTRLNSSHLVISYAVFCLKKKKIINEVAGQHLPDPPGPVGRTRARNILINVVPLSPD